MISWLKGLFLTPYERESAKIRRNYPFTPSPNLLNLLANLNNPADIYTQFWYLELRSGEEACWRYGPIKLFGTKVPFANTVFKSGKLDNFKLVSGESPDIYVTGSVGYSGCSFNMSNTNVVVGCTVTIDSFNINLGDYNE